MRKTPISVFLIVVVIVQKTQLIKQKKLLNDSHEVIKVTGDDLKLSKYYWALHDFKWRSRKCFPVVSASLKLTIDSGSTKREVQYLNVDKNVALVGAPINALHNLTKKEDTREQKITGHIVKLESKTLGPQCIIIGYQRCWWPSLNFDAPVVSFKIGVNILSKLCAALLLRLRVMSAFLVAIRCSPVELGGLGLHSLEVESMEQAINNIASLCTVDTPTTLLIKTMIEHVHLEIGVLYSFFSLQYRDYRELVTDSWTLALWRIVSVFSIIIRIPELQLGMCKQQGDE